MKRALIFWLFCLIGLAACDQRSDLPPLSAEVGVQAVFRQGGRELLMEVVGVEGPVLRTEIMAGTQMLSLRDYYRGLLPIAGTDGERNFNFEFDTSKLDKLFPLAVGNTVSLSGKMAVQGFENPLEVVVQATVKKQTTIALDRDTYDVMVVEIEQIYRGPNGVRTRTDTYYHAPSLSMNLKSVTRDGEFQTYWYVTNVKRKGAPIPASPRRPGSVMI